MTNDSGFISYALEHEAVIRTSIFLTIIGLMIIYELLAARRKLSVSRVSRWSSNLGLLTINIIVTRLLFPAAAVGFALTAAQHGWGLFNALELPFWLEVIGALILLDLAIYLQHLLMHRIPLLWRLHRVHHADLDFDVTTGLRFHSIEIVLSMLLKWLLIILLGPAAFAVLIFEVVLNGMAIFNHANVSLPAKLEKVIRKLLVTPDMHRVHHSILRNETNSNYGFNLSVWDRLFKTYRAQPEKGHDAMTIGIPEFRDAKQVNNLRGILMLPFVSKQ